MQLPHSAFVFPLPQDGMFAVLNPWLGRDGLDALSPSVAKVAEHVQQEYRNALRSILAPDMQR